MTNTTSKRTYEHGSGRERVLDAYTELLLDGGPAAATLDAVARKAGISKGGLLHHFGSKEALLQGLLDRLRVGGDAEIQEAVASSADIVRSYLEASASTDDEVSQTYLAVMHLTGESDQVTEAIRYFLNLWRDTLQADIKDPVYTRMVQLIGDGLYLHALAGSPPDEADDAVIRLVSQITSMVRARTQQ